MCAIYMKTMQKPPSPTVSENFPHTLPLSKGILKENKDYSLKHYLQNSAEEANFIYKHEDRKYGAVSVIGGKFGWFSAKRHKEEDVGDIFLRDLKKHKESKISVKFIMNKLTKEGSLWSYYKGYHHSFNNYFLYCLRYENIEAYRKIIGDVYYIKFISGSITLYRRDTRNEKTIFDQGFMLKSSANDSTLCKAYYAKPITNSCGISFSKEIPSTLSFFYNFGDPDFYYEIQLSDKQNFLLIDIDNSPRNKGKVEGLKEVNSMDNIPVTAIYKKVSITTGTMFNSKFSEHAKLEDSPVIHKGCCY